MEPYVIWLQKAYPETADAVVSRGASYLELVDHCIRKFPRSLNG